MALAVTIYNGTPANGLYLVIQRQSDGYAWDDAAGALEAYSAGSLADYSIALSQLGGDMWGATIPATLPVGDYNFTFYEQAGGSEAITDPVLPGSYSGYWNGGAVGPSASGYVGRYTSYAILVRRFGLVNVATWSNTEGGSSVNDDAIEDAIDGAEDEIDQLFHNGIYTLPFTATGASLPHTLVEWATVLAANYLYTRRGMSDEKNVIQPLADAAYKEIAKYTPGFPRQLRGVALDSTKTLGAVSYNASTGALSNGRTVTHTNSPTRIGTRFIAGYGYAFMAG